MKLTHLSELVEEGEIVKGRWELTPNHEIQYRSEAKNEEIRLKGSLIAAEPGALVISITERQTDQKLVTSLVKLAGTWSLDSKNRIVFEIEKEKGGKDSLIFKGAWQIGKSQEIVYSYEQINLKTKVRDTRTLAFQGYWGLTEKNGLVYYLGESSNSAFKLRGAFQTQSILAKKGEIRYQAGVEINGRHKVRNVVLFGKWKLSRQLGLSFEIEYRDGRKKSIAFGGEYSLNDDDHVTVNLKNEEGAPLGFELILTKDLFKNDGQAFLRLRKSIEESGVEAGMRFRW